MKLGNYFFTTNWQIRNKLTVSIRHAMERKILKSRCFAIETKQNYFNWFDSNCGGCLLPRNCYLVQWNGVSHENVFQHNLRQPKVNKQINAAANKQISPMALGKENIFHVTLPTRTTKPSSTNRANMSAKFFPLIWVWDSLRCFQSACDNFLVESLLLLRLTHSMDFVEGKWFEIELTTFQFPCEWIFAHRF